MYGWWWGNQAHGEVGEQAVASFVGEFMIERTSLVDVEEEEEEGAGRSDHQQGEKKQKQKEGGLEKRLEMVVKVIERAARRNLTNVKPE